jgi:hypothetical protein
LPRPPLAPIFLGPRLGLSCIDVHAAASKSHNIPITKAVLQTASGSHSLRGRLRQH